MRHGLTLGAVALALLIAPAAARAQVSLFQGQEISLKLDGYIRAISVLHDLGFQLPDEWGPTPDTETGLHGQVGRLRWHLEGPRWRVEVHNRLQLRITSQSTGEPVVGFGVGAEPPRLADLRTYFLERDRLMAWHDIDRLSLTANVGPADLTVGRQPITWGTATLFPVADLWTTFGPFEQDTDEKPGIDAARTLLYPGAGIELDLVVAHRGDLEDLSAGARITASRASADIWGGAGKFWRQIMAMGGITLLGDHSRWRAEAVLPWDMDDRSFQQPRITLGAERIGGTRSIGVEYHYNGIGTRHTDRYLLTSLDPRVQRGETYYLGRHYAGAIGTWSPDQQNRLLLSLTTMANLGDGSLVVSPNLNYDLGQAVRLSLGGLISAGASPRFATSPPFVDPRSEFRLYGDALFTLISVYF